MQANIKGNIKLLAVSFVPKHAKEYFRYCRIQSTNSGKLDGH